MIDWDKMINSISGKTLAEELEIARAIGGRLPYRAYVSMIKRGIMTPHCKRKRLKTKQAPRQSRRYRGTKDRSLGALLQPAPNF